MTYLTKNAYSFILHAYRLPSSTYIGHYYIVTTVTVIYSLTITKYFFNRQGYITKYDLTDNTIDYIEETPHSIDEYFSRIKFHLHIKHNAYHSIN
jgi:hypothetical protein